MTGFPFLVPGVSPGSEVNDLRTLQRLIDDLTRYAADGGPTVDEIMEAPLLRGARSIPDAVAVRLAGIVAGHPRVQDGPAVTSRIYAIDRGGAWVRSYSRLWRLEPAREAQWDKRHRS